MSRRHLSEITPTADGPLQAKLDEHDTALDLIEATAAAPFTGLTSGALVKNNAGVPVDAVRSIDYVAPQKTANVASATTITLPETGLLVPITGTTQIDFITKPTGDAPRLAILWFQSAITVRNNVAGAGAGAANIRTLQGAAVNHVTTFAADSFFFVVFDGTVWRKATTAAHWDGSTIVGADALGKVSLDSSTGVRVQYNGTAHSILINNTAITIESPILRLTTRVRLDQGTVAAGANLALPANCGSVLVTGSGQTINTFTGTGWEEGMIVLLEFDGVNTITDNSGGANDFLAKTAGNITTAAGMVLLFRFDGTDFKEVGR